MDSVLTIDSKKTQKAFNILSIDGGGILGLYSAKILTLIEKEFFIKEETYASKFDLIAGTSTGGIIALGLALGRKACEIASFYEKYGNQIFNKKWYTKLCWLITYRYSALPLCETLTKFFDSKKVKDCQTKILIPAIDVSNCQPLIFKTDHNGSLTRDLNTKLVDIALATSAAPTYFPLHRFGNYRGLVDGGLWQNNPALFAVIEACTYFVGADKEYERINVLSIGNPLSAIKETVSVEDRKSGLIKWMNKIVSVPMKISSFGTDDILSFISRNKALFVEKYLRIESKNLANKKEYKKLSLDYVSPRAYSMLSELSNHDFNKNKSDIIKFFKE